MNRDTILVTGGAGFVGYHLCKRLLLDGYEVISLDNLSSGRVENIIGLKTPKFLNVRHDINDYYNEKVGGIFNLACLASPKFYRQDPIYTTMTCVQGMNNMLKLALTNNCTILQASTSEVYGDPLISVQAEHYNGNVNPIGIRSCYDEGKRCAESLCMDYNRTYELDTKIVRIFNTYGPNMRQDDGRVIPNFICQSLRGEDITINGDGCQTRSFQYIDDLIEGVIKVYNSNLNRPVNLGNPQEITILNLAKLIIELTGSKSGIKFNPSISDDPKQRCPNIELAQSIGYQPSVPLEEGLIKTIKYFKNEM